MARVMTRVRISTRGVEMVVETTHSHDEPSRVTVRVDSGSLRVEWLTDEGVRRSMILAPGEWSAVHSWSGVPE